MAKNVNSRMRQKCDTLANWQSAIDNSNFAPLDGEIIVIKDAFSYVDAEGNTIIAPGIKIGKYQDDGATLTPLADLPYLNTDGRTIISTEETDNGFVLTLSDGSTITLNHGQDGVPGQDGENGGYYTPSVADNGDLSWTPSKEGMNDVATVNIKGPQGIQGNDGTSVTITSIDQSIVSGGVSTVTFSDNKILSIYNGKDGAAGESGTSVDLPISRGDIDESLVFFNNGGSALGEYSTVGGAANLGPLKPIWIEREVRLVTSVLPPQAAANQSTAIGGDAKALALGSYAIGPANVAGVFGCYWDEIDFSTNTISLTTTPRLTDSETLTPYNVEGIWEVGDIISIINNHKHSAITTIESINGNIITVKEIPFSTVEYDLTEDVPYESGDERTVCAFYERDYSEPYIITDDEGNEVEQTDKLWTSRPGVVELGWGSIVLGAMNLSSGAFNLTGGYKNFNAGDYGLVVGVKNVGRYSGLVGGAQNNAGEYSIVAGRQNVAPNSYDSIIAGELNEVTGTMGMIVGANNNVKANFSIIGGYGNTSNNANGGTKHIISGINNQVDGQNNIVSGESNTVTTCHNSFITGYKNISTNNTNVIGGNVNNVSGYSTLVEGDGNTVSGNMGVIVGSNNTVSGNFCIVAGYDNKAEGTKELVQGQGNAVSGACSGTLGIGNTVSGAGSFALGGYADPANSDTIIGLNNISGYGSMAIGTRNTITAYNSLAIGNRNTINTHARDTQTENFYKTNSFIAGLNNTISGYSAGIIGESCSISSSASKSFVCGEANHATSGSQFIAGVGNKVSTWCGAAVGKWCKDNGYLFMVGNGSGNSYTSSAFAVQENGTIVVSKPANSTNGTSPTSASLTVDQILTLSSISGTWTPNSEGY